MKHIKIYFILIMTICFCSYNYNAVAKPGISAKCAVAIDSKSKVVLYEKNAEMLVPVASTTKIMTALVAIKYGNPDKIIEVSPKAANINGSSVGYKAGEKVKLKELLYGLMMRSGNDAAIAIAEGISGSVDGFIKLMNEYALELGLHNTHFESPHGLDSEEHYSTAYDLALITIRAKENILFNEIVSSKDVDGKLYGFTRSYHNINKILWRIKEADGVKTGTTGKAGKCLVTSVKIDGNDVIIVVLNCNERWKETCNIHDYVKKNYQYKKMYSKGQIVDKMPIENGRGEVNLICPEDIIIPTKNDLNYRSEIKRPKAVKAPIYKDQKVGSIYIYENDKAIFGSYLQVEKSSNVLNKFEKVKNWIIKKLK